MKKRSMAILALSLVLVLALLLSACPSSTPEPTPTPTPTPTPETPKPVELSIAHGFPPQSPEGQITNKWAEKIAEDSNGLLTARVYGGSTLLTVPELLDGVMAGTADIVYGPVVKPEGFELSASLNFILTACDTHTAVKVYEDLCKQFPEAVANEFKDVKVLWLTPTVPQNIFLAKKKVQTMGDMKGVQVRVPSKECGTLIERLGGTPVYMTSADMAVAIEKGTIDGIVVMDSAIQAYKFPSSIVKYRLTMESGSFGVPTPFFLAMHPDSYNQLHPDFQKVIDDSLEWGRQLTIETWASLQVDAEAWFEDGGGEFIYLSPEEEAKWLAVRDGVQEEAMKVLDEKGLPGTEVLQLIHERLEYYASQ